MGRQSIGAPNEFSRALMDAVEAVRIERGVTTPALISRSGLSRNYYYKRARGEAPLSTNDIQSLADALSVPLRTLLEPAIGAVERLRAPRTGRPDPALLGYRLRKLAAVRMAQEPTLQLDRAVSAALAKRGRFLTPASWDALLAGEPVEIRDEDLAAIATYFDQVPEYLLQVSLPGIIDVIDARLEFEGALAENVGVGLAARSVTAASPRELLAMAAAIRRAGAAERETADSERTERD